MHVKLLISIDNYLGFFSIFWNCSWCVCHHHAYCHIKLIQEYDNRTLMSGINTILSHKFLFDYVANSEWGNIWYTIMLFTSFRGENRDNIWIYLSTTIIPCKEGNIITWKALRIIHWQKHINIHVSYKHWVGASSIWVLFVQICFLSNDLCTRALLLCMWGCCTSRCKVESWSPIDVRKKSNFGQILAQWELVCKLN